MWVGGQGKVIIWYGRCGVCVVRGYWDVSATYLLTPWSRVLLEKLTASAASQEIPHIFGNRRFITVFTSARHLSLSWVNCIQPPQPPQTSWRSILILSSHLHLGPPSGPFPQVSAPEPCAPLSPNPYMPHALPISFFSILPPSQYLVRRKDHKAPHYIILSIPLLPRLS